MNESVSASIANCDITQMLFFAVVGIVIISCSCLEDELK